MAVVADMAQAEDASCLRAWLCLQCDTAIWRNAVWDDRHYCFTRHSRLPETVAGECLLLDTAMCGVGLFLDREFWIHAGNAGEMVQA